MSVITIRVAREIKEKLELLKKRLNNKISPKMAAKLVREDRETH